MLNSATLILTILAFSLKLKSCMDDPLLLQLFANPTLDIPRNTVRDYMHSRIITVTVHAPDMNMMNVEHTVDLRDILP